MGDMLKLLGVSKRTLQRYREKKIFPYYKIEHTVIYKKTEILAILEKYRVEEKGK